MATTESKSASKSYTKSSRCWPGYEPVPGKGEHEEGSCRKKPASRNGGKEVDRETARRKQISAGGERAEQARSKSPSATERREAREAKAGKTVSGTRRSTGTARKKASKRTGAAGPGRTTTARKPAAGKAAAKKTAARRKATARARAHAA